MLLYILLLNLKTSGNLHIGNAVSKMKDVRSSYAEASEDGREM